MDTAEIIRLDRLDIPQVVMRVWEDGRGVTVLFEPLDSVLATARYYREGGEGYRHARCVTVGGKFGEEIAAEYKAGDAAQFEVVPDASQQWGYHILFHHLSLVPEAEELVRYLLEEGGGFLIFPGEAGAERPRGADDVDRRTDKGETSGGNDG
jgi:hypothetical protein